MVVKIWTSRPLSLAIVEVLEKKDAMSDSELFDALKDTQEDLGFGMLNQTLMRLEVEGKVYVSWLTKGKRRVELVKHKEK
jgi:DNA-binding PadR family transcriptional regulator